MPKDAAQNEGGKWLAWPFRLAALASFAIMIGVAWLMIWNRTANEIDARINRATNDLHAIGIELNCDRLQIGGFPFRIGITCSSLSGTDEKGGRYSAGAFRSAAQFYDPGLVVAELDGPAQIEPLGGVPLRADWEMLHASLRTEKRQVDALSLEARGISLFDGWASNGVPAMASAANAQLHLRRSQHSEDSVDIALRTTELRPGGTVMPAFDLSLALTIEDLITRLDTSLDWRAFLELHGLQGRLAEISLAPSGGGLLEISGPFSIDQEGVLTGTFDIGYSDPQALTKFLVAYLPSLAEQISVALPAIGLVASNGPDGRRSFKLNVDRGRLSIGIIPLGRIGPLTEIQSVE